MKTSININHFFWILSAIFTIAYFYLVYKFSVNIPMDDDFPSLQNFLVQFIQADNIPEKVSLLLADGNGHRLLFMRSVVLFVYMVCGKLNYSIYIFIANLLLFGTGILLYKMIRNKNMNGLWVFLTVLLLFNGQNLGNSIVAQFGLTNIGSIFIAFLSIYLLLLNHRATFVCGLLLSLLTIYSNGNGMLIIPPIIACFCIQKRTKDMICFGIISATAAMFYFYGLDASRLGNNIWSHFPEFVANFFIFIGCNLWIPSVKFVSLFTGIVCSVIYIWGIINKVYERNLFCYACLTFLFITAIAVAAGNGPVLGGESTTPRRYRIYGSLFLILTAFLLINNAKAFRVKKMLYLFPVLALFFGTKGERRWELKKVTAWRRINEGKRLGTCYPQAEPELMLYLKEAEQMGIYKMPQYPLSEYKSVIRPETDKNRQLLPDISHMIESIKEKDGFLLVEG